jgi:hypothetical protein
MRTASFMTRPLVRLGWLALLSVAPEASAQTADRPVPFRGAITMDAARALTPRRAVVEGLTEPLQSLSIVDLSGRDISTDVNPRTQNGVITLDLPALNAVVLKPREIRTEVLRDHERKILPGGAVVSPTPGSNASGAAKAVWFRLTLAASPMPAPWDPVQKSYLTRLTFGLRRPEGAPPDLVLNAPVVVKVDYQGLTAPESATITLDAPGLENEKTLTLPFTPLTAKPTLLVRSSISDVNLELTALPRLDVLPARDTVLGLGLETLSVVIARVLPDGRRDPVTRDTPLTLEVSGRARIEDDAILLATGASDARVTLRSAGLGETTIRATSDGVTGLAVVDQRFPTGPLLAVLLGGMLGGAARRFVKGARRALTGRRILEGLVVAAIAFVAGVLGVGYLNLPAAIVATEAGAFLTGALTGFIGVNVVEALAKKTGRTSA